MKVIVTGANGQLGQDLVKILSRNHTVYGYHRDIIDVSDSDSVKRVFNAVMPEVVVHAAAYTAVDEAETEIDQAFRVNAVGSRNVAVAAEEIGAKVCYISTDYVFDGNLDRPYREYDLTCPRSVYGQSKLAGEALIQTLSTCYYIVRTSWVFGVHGNNFVKTMLKVAKERDKLHVVNDQRGCPTYTVDLVRFIAELILTDKYGIYHASNSGSCTWYEFVQAIFEEAGLITQVMPCTTEEFQRQAPRPRNSVLDHLAIRTNGFNALPHWSDALSRFMFELRRKGDI